MKDSRLLPVLLFGLFVVGCSSSPSPAPSETTSFSSELESAFSSASDEERTGTSQESPFSSSSSSAAEPATVLSVTDGDLDAENKKIFILVKPGTNSLSMAGMVSVSEGSRWKLFRGETEIPTKVAAGQNGSLADGHNTFYILVSSADAMIENVYELDVYRSFYITVTYFHNNFSIGSDKAPTGYEWILGDRVIDGYDFDHWEYDGKIVDKIIPWSDVYVKAVAHISHYSLVVVSEDKTRGSVEIISGSGYAYEEITVCATPRDDYVFWFWHDGSTFVSMQTTFTFTMPARDYSLTARFVPKSEMWRYPTLADDGKSILYGLYPNTLVTDDSLISTLNSLDDMVYTFGWGRGDCRLYDGDYYELVHGNPVRNWITFRNGQPYEQGNDYWFKFEPIRWRLLSFEDGVFFLTSENIMDNRRFDTSANNYKDSEIRKWLNEAFARYAFLRCDSFIETTEVDNSAATTGTPTNPYACETTNDKVFLLSDAEVRNANYGFVHNSDRACEATDYAIAKGLYLQPNYTCSSWWTRSPYYKDSNQAGCVYDSGNISTPKYGMTIYGRDGYSFTGVRPAMRISLD